MHTVGNSYDWTSRLLCGRELAQGGFSGRHDGRFGGFLACFVGLSVGMFGIFWANDFVGEWIGGFSCRYGK